MEVIKILDDEVDDGNDDKENNEDGVIVGQGRQGRFPFSSHSRDIVRFVLEPIGRTASHRHRQYLRAILDRNNGGSIGPQSRGLIRWRSEESTRPSRRR